MEEERPARETVLEDAVIPPALAGEGKEMAEGVREVMGGISLMEEEEGSFDQSRMAGEVAEEEEEISLERVEP